MPQNLIVVCGATATGKTRMGIELALRLDGEVISADSMQVYRGLDIGTAKPTEDEMRGVPHHMIGIVSPFESYSVARYIADAAHVISEVRARGKRPILVGGTGQYIDSLLSGRTFAPFSEESGIRARLNRIKQEQGMAPLLEVLRKADPESALRLHPNDEKRILRALEVFYETGSTISEHNRMTAQAEKRYRELPIVLEYASRETLYETIDRRVDRMMEHGLLEEVRTLLHGGIPPSTAAMQAIGYKELIPALLESKPLSDAVEEIKLRSRQYAKRQLTWFRKKTNGLRILLESTLKFEDAIQNSMEYLSSSGL